MKPKYPDAQQHHAERWADESRDYQFLEHLDGCDIWLAQAFEEFDDAWGTNVYVFAKHGDYLKGLNYNYVGFTARDPDDWDQWSVFNAPQSVRDRVRVYLTLHQ